MIPEVWGAAEVEVLVRPGEDGGVGDEASHHGEVQRCCPLCVVCFSRFFCRIFSSVPALRRGELVLLLLLMAESWVAAGQGARVQKGQRAALENIGLCMDGQELPAGLVRLPDAAAAARIAGHSLLLLLFLFVKERMNARVGILGREKGQEMGRRRRGAAC